MVEVRMVVLLMMMMMMVVVKTIKLKVMGEVIRKMVMTLVTIFVGESKTVSVIAVLGKRMLRAALSGKGRRTGGGV